MENEQKSYLKDGIDFSSINRVLVIKLRHHGDVLLTSPMFTAMKQQYPHLQVDGLVYKDTQEMLSFHPFIDQLHTIDRKWKHLGAVGQLKAEWGLIQSLKNRNYDLILHMTEHWRGLILCRLLKPRYAVCQKYARRSGKLWKKTFTHHYPVNSKKRHTAEKHLDALRRVGLYPTSDQRRLVAAPGEKAVANIDKVMADHEIKSGEYIHIHPTSRWLFKSWDVPKMAALISELGKQGNKLVITAAPSNEEMRMVEHIFKCIEDSSKPEEDNVKPKEDSAKPEIVNLAGKVNLKELMVLIDRAKLFIGVDSVPMHIASATATPTVALFGPSNELEWSPWMNKHIILSSSHSCRPCDLAGCGDGWKSECLSEISLEQVVSAANRLTV